MESIAKFILYSVICSLALIGAFAVGLTMNIRNNEWRAIVSPEGRLLDLYRVENAK